VPKQFRNREGVGTGCSHASCCTVPRIVKANIGQIALSRRFPKRGCDVLGADSEDTICASAELPLAGKGVFHSFVHWHHSRLSCLARFYLYDASSEVEVGPMQSEDFASPHACAQCHSHSIRRLGPVEVEPRQHQLLLFVSHVSHSTLTALEPFDRSNGIFSQEPAIDCHSQDATQQGQLSIDRLWCPAFAAPGWFCQTLSLPSLDGQRREVGQFDVTQPIADQFDG